MFLDLHDSEEDKEGLNLGMESLSISSQDLRIGVGYFD